MHRAAVHWLTSARLRVYPRIMLILFVGTMLVILLRWSSGNSSARLPFSDFSVYWLASYLALKGQASAVFEATSFCGPLQELVPASACGYPWLYPPGFYLFIVPLAWMPYWVSYLGFMGGSIAAYVFTMRRIIQGELAMWCLAAFPGLWMNIFSGQNGCWTAALAGGALINLERRPVLSGLLIGSLSIKPHLALLFPVALLAAGSWRTFFAAAAAAVTWLAAALWILGTGTLEGWWLGLATGRQMLEQTDIVRMMPTVFAFLRLSGFSVMSAYIGHFLFAGIALLSVWSIWRRNQPSSLKYAALITATLLISPYLLEYDLAWLALPIAWMTQQGLQTGWRRWEREILVATWLAPLLCIALAKACSIQLGAGVLLALLWMIVRRSNEPGQGSGES